MNRRNFFRIGAAGALSLPAFPSRLGAAQETSQANRETSSPLAHTPDLVRRALSTRILGFPTIAPTFAGIFLPGGKSTRLISANSFTSFNTQVQTAAASGYVLASFTTIRNMNSTWYYAALQPGNVKYVLLGTSDANQFQQTFAQNQSGYTLVDFSVTWEQGQLFYTGYWLAASAPAKQTLVWDLGFNDLVTQWTNLSGQNNRMTRIQSFPQQDAAAYTALFAAGSGGYALAAGSMPSFSSDVTAKYAGNTLAGLGFDSVEGFMFGCWRDLVPSAQFVWDQDWKTLSATAQELATKGLILSAVAAYPNAPDFDGYFATNLAPFVMGYAYAVGKDGQVISKGNGFARGPNEQTNSNAAFTPDVRINLASISKAITGIAMEVLVLKFPNITLDSPFWPLISSMVPNPDPSVKTVTLRNLATMLSGLVTPAGEGPLFGDLWSHLKTYLAQPLVGTPGVTYSYNNENFTILQGVIDQVTGQDYVAWVTENVLAPAGVAPAIFNATPDPASSATLLYSGPTDTRPGGYYTAIDFVAPGGWISSVSELLKLPLALRGTSLMPASSVNDMLTGIGFDPPYVGNYGTYYNKNGALVDGLTPEQWVNTCIIRFPEGYDIALVANSHAPEDVVNICSQAFGSRGLLTSDQPPAIAAVVGTATYLPKVAPGGYCSMLGTGFTDQPGAQWTIIKSVLPTSVEGISATVNGTPAYIAYAGGTQVNVLLPSTVKPGIADIELITPIGVMSATVEVDAVAPGLFTYTLKGVLYASAVFGTGSGVVYVGAPGSLPGSTTRPAAAGDIIELFATGCGPTQPAAPDGLVPAKAYPAANLAAFQVTIAGKSAPVLFAGLTGAGLWQINVQIPKGLVGGNQPLILSVNKVASQPNVIITVLGG
jgi:uncharacterized protein (TIGR03437 family)